jgi:hypothetical protein
MNTLSNRLIAKISAILLVFTMTCMSVLAATPVEADITASLQQGSGQVVTTNNQPIIVNGNSAPAGTTILSGATLETPPGVGATLQLGFADLEIAPDSEVIVEFTSDGNVKVTLKRGCAVLKKKDDKPGGIITPDGTTTETSKKKRAAVCFPLGATSPVVSEGAAAGAAGAAGGAVGGGISNALLTALIVGGIGGGIIITAVILTNNDEPASGISPG